MKFSTLMTVAFVLFWTLFLNASNSTRAQGSDNTPRAQQPDRPRNYMKIPTDLVVTWAHKKERGKAKAGKVTIKTRKGYL
ncbi:MAG: hypothetical protein L0220_28990, partial [Acidobacteria bacterium]|nr:hypothetical protein [Acidobacteriota bacterium]